MENHFLVSPINCKLISTIPVNGRRNLADVSTESDLGLLIIYKCSPKASRQRKTGWFRENVENRDGVG